MRPIRLRKQRPANVASLTLNGGRAVIRACLSDGEQRGLTLTRIRVLIADDHGLVRAGIRALLEKHSSIEVVDEASNGLEALRLVRQHQPDVVLMDISMPELNGMEVVRILAKRLSESALHNSVDARR